MHIMGVIWLDIAREYSGFQPGQYNLQVTCQEMLVKLEIFSK